MKTMEKTYTADAIKNQMRILKEMLEMREARLVDDLDDNMAQRARLLRSSGKIAPEDFDELADEGMEISRSLANVRIQINNIANALLVQL